MIRGLIQLTLDLFDTEPPPLPRTSPVQPSGKAPKRRIKAPAPTPVTVAEPPAATVAPLTPSAPAQPLDQAVAPLVSRHPRANREANLGELIVAYEVRRARRRSIGFLVGPEGLTVSAPKWIPLYEIDKAVLEKTDWIRRKLAEMRERQRQLDANRIEWKDGASFPFLGETVILVIDPRQALGAAGAVLHADEAALPGVPRLTLHVGLPQSAAASQIRDAVQAWLQRQAKRVFTERLDHFAPGLGVRWRRLSLSSAGTRWGSASADGSIRLNWRLIHFRREVIDYVVAHELSHLRVMDHSPRFWETVRTAVPDYEQLRAQLKDEALPQW